MSFFYAHISEITYLRNLNYLISNEKGGSHFVEVKPENLFEEYNSIEYAN